MTFAQFIDEIKHRRLMFTSQSVLIIPQESVLLIIFLSNKLLRND